MSVITELRDLCRLPNPFEGFDYKAYPHDMQGGATTQVMAQVFNVIKPRIIVEVGTWKGRSASYWASFFRQNKMDGAVVCVDTWLGAIEHLEGTRGPDWDIRPYMKHGFPYLYYQFLANMAHEGVQDYIFPLPCTSTLGAQYLANRGIKADIVYIDASHEENDVYEDAKAYWKIVRPGGVISGDDYHVSWCSVICGVNRFAKEVGLPIQFGEVTWVIQKPR
jgi:hypothetical protein